MWTCKSCGKDTDYFLVDGYDVGDTLLEGVLFEIRESKGKLVANTPEDAKGYLAELNEKLWLKRVAKYAADSSEDCPETWICPVCKQSLNEDDSRGGVQIQVLSFDDVIKKMFSQ